MTAEIKSYRTIAGAGTNEMTIKKSRFITSMQRCNSTAEAEQFIAKIKKQYHDATHNTFAYRIGNLEKASDNGEPQGTAGVPELTSLRLMKLTNVASVVTRYFGGIKLGAGGLVRAYANSVTNCAEKIGLVVCRTQLLLTFSCNYHQLGLVQNYLRQNEIAVAKTDYGSAVTWQIYLDADPDLVQKTSVELSDLLSRPVNLKKLATSFREIPLSKAKKIKLG
ncbi:MAG: YigZ family protein [Lactobacillus sp.]